MPKMRVRGGKLTVTIPAQLREEITARDGEEINVSTEGDRIVLMPAAERPLPGDIEALEEAEAEFAQGKTRRLDDILHGRVGRTTR